ncbi:MAG TPA: flagellar hook-basal body complex protein [Thermohalobaculum sp.]|nr:flagellar hook-basal body complex protein [Thermohalobaculum sp.]
MSLSSSLNAGVAGLSVNSTRLAAISDNIANSSTNGYRRANVEFGALVTPSGPNSYTAGGVAAATYRDVATSGSLIATNSSTDISVSGRGMLPVTTTESVELAATERPFQMVATGAFSRDESGYLVSRNGLTLLGWPTNADGELLNPVTRESPTSLQPIQISPFLTVSEPTTRMSIGLNLPASETTAGAAGDPFFTTIEYFDSIGRGNLMRVEFTPTVPATGTSNQWRVSFYDSATSATVPVAELDVEFDPSRVGRGSLLSVTPVGGVPYDPVTGTATVTVADGPVEIFMGSPSLDGGLIQLESPFAPISVSKNGAPAGNLATLQVNDQGLLQAVYDTGQIRSLFQIPLVNVPNPNGLTVLDGQSFAPSPESGSIYLWDANTGPVGTVVGFSLQQSTVDVARELTDLIQTQRAYSSNATTIRTVDEMLQETTNLKR